MSAKERAELEKLTDREMMILLTERSEVMTDSFTDFVKSCEGKFSGLDATTTKIRIDVAILKTKAIAWSGVAAVVISIIVGFITKGL